MNSLAPVDGIEAVGPDPLEEGVAVAVLIMLEDDIAAPELEVLGAALLLLLLLPDPPPWT